MIEKNTFSASPDSHKILCPVCENKRILTRKISESFPYGSGKEEVILSAIVQVHSCQDCQFEFTDEFADQAKHDAICQHLEVMPPKQVALIREQYKLSRAEFARVTRIGEASINRWEKALLIQNAAMDQYLYLLLFPENFERIRQRNEHSSRSLFPESEQQPSQFRSLKITPKLRRRAEAFKLVA